MIAWFNSYPKLCSKEFHPCLQGFWFVISVGRRQVFVHGIFDYLPGLLNTKLQWIGNFALLLLFLDSCLRIGHYHSWKERHNTDSTHWTSTHSVIIQSCSSSKWEVLLMCPCCDCSSIPAVMWSQLGHLATDSLLQYQFPWLHDHYFQPSLLASDKQSLWESWQEVTNGHRIQSHPCDCGLLELHGIHLTTATRTTAIPIVNWHSHVISCFTIAWLSNGVAWPNYHN